LERDIDEINQPTSLGALEVTRKSRYGKDDCAMGPIYECPGNCM